MSIIMNTALKAFMVSVSTSSLSRVRFSTSMVYAPIIRARYAELASAEGVSAYCHREDRVHLDELEQIDAVMADLPW